LLIRRFLLRWAARKLVSVLIRKLLGLQWAARKLQSLLIRRFLGSRWHTYMFTQWMGVGNWEIGHWGFRFPWLARPQDGGITHWEGVITYSWCRILILYVSRTCRLWSVLGWKKLYVSRTLRWERSQCLQAVAGIGVENNSRYTRLHASPNHEP
jgi:hypothetical protein